jgi:hypothetical protein
VNAPEPIEQDDDEGGSHANNSQEGARRIREGAGFWHLADSLCRPSGRIRREKAGPKGSAIKLYQKRKTEILQGKKLPEQLRNRIVRFSEIADDAESYCKANNQGFQFDAYRIGRLKEQFGNYSAEIPVEDFRRWFSEQEWKAGTYNRYKSTLSDVPPGNREQEGYDQSCPRAQAKTGGQWSRALLESVHAWQTEAEYLKARADEESRLRALIQTKIPSHMPEFEIALHTGMRPSEQYGLTRDRVDLVRKQVTILKSKNGNTRHIPLNSIAVGAFQ